MIKIVASDKGGYSLAGPPQRALSKLGFSSRPLDILVHPLADFKNFPYPELHGLDVVECLLPCLLQDLNWIEENCLFVRGFQTFNSGARVVMEGATRSKITAEYTTGAPPDYSDLSITLNKLFGYIVLTLNRNVVSMWDLGYGVTSLWLFNDLLRGCGNRYYNNREFYKQGHLSGSVYQGLFIIIRESGGEIKGCSGLYDSFKAKSPYTDTDGSYATGLVSLREKNPYLDKLVEFLLPRVRDKFDSERAFLEYLGHTAPWIQYYISILANRLRCRGGECSALVNLRPLSGFPSGITGRITAAKVTADVGEIYVGNLNRMKSRESISMDVNRALKNSYFSEFDSNYKRFKSSNQR